MRELVTEYRDIYGGGIWVYDSEGNLLESAYDSAPTDAVLESARLGGLDEQRLVCGKRPASRTAGW